MQLEMLISSVNQNPEELLKKMHVNCDAVLINQCDKSDEEKINIGDYEIKVIPNDEVRDILIKLLELPNILNKSYNEATLNYVSEYLYEIASLFNKFYNNHNIMHEDELDKTLYDLL